MNLQTNVAPMFAALSATNEAILYAKSPEQLFRQVCHATLSSGDILTTAILLLVPGTGNLELTAGAGLNIDWLRALEISVDANKLEGKGLCGEAFRTQKPCLSNDFLNDPHSLAWRKIAEQAHIGAAAALPLLRAGQSVGVMLVYLRDAGTLNREITELLTRVSTNISFALDNFEREKQRFSAESAKQRLSCLFAALTATNEAILRAHSPDEMFRMVCEAVVEHGQLLGTAVYMSETDSSWLNLVAGAGASPEMIRGTRFSSDPTVAEGQELGGVAFRTGKPCISDDVQNDPRVLPGLPLAARTGLTACGVFPLFTDAKPVGVIYFLFGSGIGRLDDEMTKLMGRVCENVSFGLDMFRRNGQKDRISRMFAALGATNEAIMRAKSRAELFDLVCEAAVVGGNFTSTAIALVKPDSDFLQIVASAGSDGERTRNMRLSVDASLPEGHGITGIAFRTHRPCISNDYLADFGGAGTFSNAVRDSGTRSGAGLPLLKDGKAIGVLVFLSGELGAFSDELIELLQRLADNISFALANFDRADEKNRADARIEYLASHDSLTQLPNRETFNQLLHFTIEAARRFQRRFAVLFIDLDRFKVINDSLGHEAGDTLLVEIARRLRQSLRASDVVARLGGDEFVVILESTGDNHAVENVTQALLTALSQPVQLSGHECHTTASIGIALFPADGTDVQTLTKNADMAMYRAKEDGKNGFRFFTKAVKTQSIERLMLETSLRHALERDEFSLHYQPKVNLGTGEITGVEALLRWTHPELGMLPPTQFIPLAEETGLIVPIGRWVLKKACAQNMAWLQQGLQPVSMAVNLSPRQFADENLLQDIDNALDACGLPPGLLQLEVTESMVMMNVSRAIKTLDGIQSRGIRLAIDDFGTGYSSMSLMKQFPIDTIKIDRSFVNNLAEDCEDQAIAQAIISMGNALGMTIVAEGVETTAQETFLRDHACDEMQGYLFSKPVLPEQLADLLRPALSSLYLAPPLQPTPAADAEPADAQPMPTEGASGG